MGSGRRAGAGCGRCGAPPGGVAPGGGVLLGRPARPGPAGAALRDGAVGQDLVVGQELCRSAGSCLPGLRGHPGTDLLCPGWLLWYLCRWKEAGYTHTHTAWQIALCISHFQSKHQGTVQWCLNIFLGHPPASDYRMVKTVGTTPCVGTLNTNQHF